MISNEPDALGKLPWGAKHLRWIRQLTLPHAAHDLVRQDHLAEVEHRGERVARLEQALAAIVRDAAPPLREVIAGLQTLRGVGPLTG